MTAGNASTLNDGAAATVMASERGLEELGAEPLAGIVAIGVTGVDPAVNGNPADPRDPQGARGREARPRPGRAGRDQRGVRRWSSPASAASTSIPRMLNVNGGAIALGHPLGCSGARLAGTLARELKREGLRYGVAALCVGVGQGLATIIENPQGADVEAFPRQRAHHLGVGVVVLEPAPGPGLRVALR